MNKQDNLLTDIIRQTENGSLKWENISPGQYHEYIFQSNYAYQAFSAKYRKPNQDYTLVLVHKKLPSHNPEFDTVEEKHYTELLIIAKGRLVYQLNKYNVEGQLLGTISDLVESHNDDAKLLFGDEEE